MTYNHLKTNNAKLAHYRVKIRKVIEFFDFQSLMQHSLYPLLKFLHIDNEIFLDSPFRSEKVVTGIAAVESSVLAAKVYFTLYCSGSEYITPLSSNTVA